jgi:hypothetical protein
MSQIRPACDRSGTTTRLVWLIEGSVGGETRWLASTPSIAWQTDANLAEQWLREEDAARALKCYQKCWCIPSAKNVKVSNHRFIRFNV